MVTPKAFISHATEDKERFVLPFATKLREKGVDAWVDQWEIKAGESLVDRIFESGIKDASIFIVVLSSTSIAKPWVRDELDAGVMRRISGQSKVIPILLDAVPVPVALQHTLYLSVPSDGFTTVVDKTIRSIFDIDHRPPLGPPPTYAATTSLPKLLPDPVDNAVFNAIIDLTLDESVGTITKESLSKHLVGMDISADSLEESVEILTSRSQLDLTRLLSGDWFVSGVPATALLRALEARGVDVGGLKLRLLATIVNDSAKSYRTFEDQPLAVTGALLTELENRGLIACIRTLSGDIWIERISAEATRMVRRG